MRIFLIVITILISLAERGYTAPAINQPITGQLTDGQNITIRGTGFGLGPNVVLFDDFESGTTGANIKTGAGSAKYGQWVEFAPSETDVTEYSTLSKVSGSKSFFFSFDGPTGTRYIRRVALPSVKDVFISRWIYVPAGDNWPGQGGNAEAINFKTIWLYDCTDGTKCNDWFLPVVMGSDTAVNMHKVSGNYSASTYSKATNPGDMNLPFDIKKGSWNRSWFWVKGSTTGSSFDGEIRYWGMGSSGINMMEMVGRNITRDGGVFTNINFPGYGRLSTPAPCRAAFDDIYVATGPNAQARVEIGNASTYVTSSKLTILTPITWSDGSITAQVNRGQFNATGEQAWAFVINSSGVASPGYPVTWGQAAADTEAPYVVATSPQDGATGIAKNTPYIISFDGPINPTTVSGITISPGSKGTITTEGATVTMPTSGQADNTLYTVTIPTTVKDTSGNSLYPQKTFTYRTVAASATCTTDSTLCVSQTECTTNYPAYNFCTGETPPCRAASCSNTCSASNFTLCAETQCLALGSTYSFWENSCRTVDEPDYLTGGNLVSNPNMVAWFGEMPASYNSYYPSYVHRDTLGARMDGLGHITQTLIEPDTDYFYAYNITAGDGQTQVYHLPDTEYYKGIGTKVGIFRSPSEPIQDHQIYFGMSGAGGTATINNLVLRKIITPNCSTDPDLCYSEAECNLYWFWYDNKCNRDEPDLGPGRISFSGDLHGNIH